ncbi:hypothetical protein, partial [Kitasatospora cineracea]|uniref:hypothetical protein n=1 Tax=Kitasatospora cineracea TaxID=88074 RepID=UPI00340D6A94
MARASGWWAGLYAAVQLGWAATATTVPWSAHLAYPAAAFPLLAALAVLAAAAIRAGSGSRWGRVVLWTAIPVYAAGGVGLPVHFVQLATLSGLESATGLTQVVLDAAGAALLALTALARHRHRTGRCPRCGHRHTGPADGPLRHPAPTPPTRRTRTTAYLLLLGLLPWAGVKTLWTLGGNALGVTAAAWAATASDGASGAGRTLARLGIDLTVLAAAVGVLLLLGLLHRWGQTFPRPIPLLGGRRVPRLLPLVPAWLTGVPLTLYGLALTATAPLLALGALPRPTPAPPFVDAAGLIWMIAFGGFAFTGLGLGLLVAARSYAARTRPVCAGRPAATGGGDDQPVRVGQAGGHRPVADGADVLQLDQ